MQLICDSFTGVAFLFAKRPLKRLVFKYMEEQASGFILLDKPSGPTSHGMVSFLRRITGIKRIGHAGTLDPFASGLLIMGVGRQATKRLGTFLKQDKEYEATLFLGKTTDTFDTEGKVTSEYGGRPIEDKVIKEVLKSFQGKQKQTPPMFSAKKIGGKKLYELARVGKEVEREACDVEVHELEALNYDWPELKVRVKCSSGTYIRSLANDVGAVLGCGAYLTALRRTAIGSCSVKGATSPDGISSENWKSILTL
jgi:tRNA pseudouridine55 synthase